MAAAPALHQAAKTFKSAVCLVPPRHTWGPIQEVRCFNDKSYVRWPPHINVLYPFLEAQHLEAAAAVAAEALREQQPFDVHLREFGHFEHGRSCTLWLRPEAPGAAALGALLYGCYGSLLHVPASHVPNPQPPLQSCWQCRAPWPPPSPSAPT